MHTHYITYTNYSDQLGNGPQVTDVHIYRYTDIQKDNTVLQIHVHTYLTQIMLIIRAMTGSSYRCVSQTCSCPSRYCCNS